MFSYVHYSVCIHLMSQPWKKLWHASPPHTDDPLCKMTRMQKEIAMDTYGELD